jgi:hypothetical protein
MNALLMAPVDSKRRMSIVPAASQRSWPMIVVQAPMGRKSPALQICTGELLDIRWSRAIGQCQTLDYGSRHYTTKRETGGYVAAVVNPCPDAG